MGIFLCVHKIQTYRQKKYGCVSNSVADPHHDPLLILMWIRVRLFNLMRIRILLLINAMQICNNRYWPPGLPRLHFESLCLQGEPPRLHFERPELLKFGFDADADLAFDFDADAELTSAFTLVRFRIQLPKMMRIHADWIRNTGLKSNMTSAYSDICFTNSIEEV